MIQMNDIKWRIWLAFGFGLSYVPIAGNLGIFGRVAWMLVSLWWVWLLTYGAPELKGEDKND